MYAKPPTTHAFFAFSLCRVCGKPAAFRTTLCAACHQQAQQAAQQNVRELAERRLVYAFFSRATPVAYGIFFINLMLYLLMAKLAGGPLLDNLLHGVNERTLLAFGAKSNEAMQYGDLFRFITPLFLHNSGLHLLSNCFALAIVGPQVERLYGSARFLLIYLLAGFGGMLGNLVGDALEGRRVVVSVGASGAICGLFGLLAAFAYKYRGELPASLRKAFATAMLPAIAVNLIIGFSVPFIDNSTHLGGLLAGVILAFIIPYLAPGQERVSQQSLVLMTACVMLLCYCFTRAYEVSPRYLSSGAMAGGAMADSTTAAESLPVAAPPEESPVNEDGRQ